MGTVEERKALERLSGSWRRITAGAKEAIERRQLPAPEEEAPETPPEPPGAPERPRPAAQ